MGGWGVVMGLIMRSEFMKLLFKTWPWDEVQANMIVDLRERYPGVSLLPRFCSAVPVPR